MPSRLKYLLLTLSLFCVAVLVAAFVYERHLRFVMGDWPRLASPSTVVEFSKTRFPTTNNALVLDGLCVPFAESEIKAVRCVSFVDSGIQSTRHPPTTKLLLCQLKDGIEVGISFPKQEYLPPEAFLYEFQARIASPKDFSWRMTSNQIDELCNKIIYQASRAKVKRIGLRTTESGSEMFRDYGGRKEVEWLFNEGTWSGCVHFSFINSKGFQSDDTKQLEFTSNVKVISSPKGTFEQEVLALIARVAASN